MVNRVIADPLAPGAVAPEFRLPDQHGAYHALSDYRGRWVVLYFYPKDDTPGCTQEACAFRDGFLHLKQMDAVALGVSLDDNKSHARFARKYNLPFSLLSDTNGKVAKAYEALWAFGPIRLTKRHSFIIDPSGRIARIYRKVKPDTHIDEVIAALAAERQTKKQH